MGVRIETPIDEGTKARRHEGTKASRYYQPKKKREKVIIKGDETQRNGKN